MITYETIPEAFRRGTGDAFFTKEGRYLAVSRHDLTPSFLEEMKGKGFEWMKYDQVVTMAGNQKSEDRKFKPEPKSPKRFINYDLGTFSAFYDEFPDAYNNHL